MRDLIIIARYPKPGTSKTRLGRQIGYENSAELAQCILEDLMATASLVCDITIAAPSLEDAVLFKNSYPSRRIFTASRMHILYQGLESIKNNFKTKPEHHIISLLGDMLVTEQDLDTWYASFQRHDLLFGLSHDGGLYMTGMKNTFGQKFVCYLTDTPTYSNFIAACYKSLKHFPRIRFAHIKRDIDFLDDLFAQEIPLQYTKTRNFIKNHQYYFPRAYVQLYT